MAIVNITVDNDADFYRVFQYQSADTSLPLDITGSVMWMMLRRHAADVEAALRLGTDTGEIVLTDPVNGTFTIFIAQLDLEQLGLGSYDHSLIMLANSIKRSIWTGTFTNNPGPSR
jgi:hypothetical protein